MKTINEISKELEEISSRLLKIRAAISDSYSTSFMYNGLRLQLTENVLDKLGFKEYNDDSGNCGTRTLYFSNGFYFDLKVRCESDDVNDVFDEPLYQNNTINYNHTFDIFFLHELYQVILDYYRPNINEFVELCKKANMYPYIREYEKYLNDNQA